MRKEEGGTALPMVFYKLELEETLGIGFLIIF